MRKSVRIIVWFTTFCTVIHGNSNEQNKTLDSTAPQPTNLSLFVDDISILTDLTGGIKRQSRLIENFVKETSRYFQATSKQFDTFYKTKPDMILKYVIDFYEDTRTLVLKSDFQKMLGPVKILKSLAIDSEDLGRSVEKKTVQEYISTFKTLKKHPPKLEFLWLELIPQLDKCLKPQENITEIGLCFLRLDVLELTTVTVTKQFDKIKEVRRLWNPVRKLIQIYAGTFEDLEIVVKSAFEFSNNSKTFSGLAESLELANEEFEECETKISEKKSKIAYRMGTVLVGSEVKVEGRTKAFLMRFPEIFVSEFLKNLVGEKHLEMLKYGFQPYLKMSETVQKVEKILEGNKWNKVGADKIRYAIRDIEKWTGPFIIPESLLDTVDKCLKMLPTVKPEFNFELFQSALNQTKTMIYEMRKFVILVDEIVSKQNEIMLALRTLKETFDGWEIRDNVRTFKSYMENIWNENGTEPIKNISSYAKLIESARNFSKTNNIAEMISQHPETNIFMEILEQFDIKRVLDVSECLSERNFHLGHVDKILEGAENMKIFRYNVNDEDIKLTKAYMAEISEILRILEETDSVIRKKTLSEETRKLNSFDRSEKVNTNLGEARDAMKRISMVKNKENEIQKAIDSELPPKDDFSEEWKKTGKNQVAKLVRQVKNLDDFIGKTQSKNLESISTVFEEAANIQGMNGILDKLGWFRHNHQKDAPEIVKNFEALENLDLEFSNHAKKLESAAISTEILRTFLNEFFGIETKTSSVSLRIKEMVPWSQIVLFCLGSLILIFLILSICCSFTKSGRKRWRRFYLDRFASERTRELHWRYSFWLDQESDKNMLCEAVREVNFEHLKALIDKGVYINVYNQFGNTPLHAAAKYGHVKIVEYLIRSGADRNAYNVENKTPEQLLIESAQTTTKLTSVTSVSEGASQTSEKKKFNQIETIFEKLRGKKFRQRIPDLLPTMSYRIRIDNRLIDSFCYGPFTERYRGNLRQLVEMHGATWSDEMLVKENFNLGSHPFHHFNLGPLFIIHDGKKNFLKQFQSDTDKMFTLMTFPEFVGFMLKLECHYDNERKMPIPVTFNLENSEL
ncbi:hypothetical protein L5515_010705 [Caenorhabditis briggsae]|uniref:ANK_REP_REGION domain-containing protein n=1 Tax=Caenorhabditis briggsae TaxID=6238 RepID=A0AAE9EMV7_CAEBR|nr:hypothetical protein L5515_010705 [Caenorhabditis briggsae]